MALNTGIEGLPPQFVTSLRVLFDILDEDKTGLVKLSDLENRWEDGAVAGLPMGVIEALQKVTPSNGKLSFERFVTGLRIALLKHRGLESQNGPRPGTKSTDTRKPHDKHLRNYTSSPAMGNKAMNATENQPAMQHRTSSMPVLQNHAGKENIVPLPSDMYRLAPKSHNTHLYQRSDNLGNYRGQMEAVRRDRKPGDGRSSIASASALEFMSGGFSRNEDDMVKRTTPKRREPRRHTLANGVDYSMIKRHKQFEHEKQILCQGLEMIDRTKDWYEEQIRRVDDKMKYIGRSDFHGEATVEASEERLNLQSVRIQELNQQLQVIIDSSHKGFPMHMNLALSHSPHRTDMAEKDNVISMLKSQNRMLTKEVSDKSDKISQLEKEKTQLIRKMFEATSDRQKPNYDDTTFI